MIRNSTCSRKSRYAFFVTMSAAPYFPPSAVRSSVMTTVPLSTGSSTIFHLMGSEEAKRGPSQYVHFSSSIFREPSMRTSAPGMGLAPTPMLASAAKELAVRIAKRDVRKKWRMVLVIGLQFAARMPQTHSQSKARRLFQSQRGCGGGNIPRSRLRLRDFSPPASGRAKLILQNRDNLRATFSSNSSRNINRRDAEARRTE